MDEATPARVVPLEELAYSSHNRPNKLGLVYRRLTLSAVMPVTQFLSSAAALTAA
jgi:hypothetical protein